MDVLFYHAIISNETYQGILNSCDFSQPFPGAQKAFRMLEQPVGGPNPIMCGIYQAQMQEDMNRINAYDILSDVCLSNNVTTDTVRATSTTIILPFHDLNPRVGIHHHSGITRCEDPKTQASRKEQRRSASLPR